ncbi:hypothetical protein L0P28_16840, partial [Dorea formicigenerans]|uniref:hypothetical protein n=1 Tax=Dorea formicigenerans TaxID=39486 RepID=UPI001EE1419C
FGIIKKLNRIDAIENITPYFPPYSIITIETIKEAAPIKNKVLMGIMFDKINKIMFKDSKIPVYAIFLLISIS